MSAKLQDFHTEPERRAALLFAQVAPRAAHSDVPACRLKVGNATLETSQKSFKKFLINNFGKDELKNCDSSVLGVPPELFHVGTWKDRKFLEESRTAHFSCC